MAEDIVADFIIDTEEPIETEFKINVVPDISGLATKEELEQAEETLNDTITAVDNKYDSITSGLSDSITAVDNKYDTVTSGLSDSIIAVDNKYDTITSGLSDSIVAVDNKYDSITGALNDSIVALDSVVSDNYNTLDDKIDSINGALSDSITALDSVVSDNYNTLDSLIGGVDDKIDTHIADKANPHEVTATQVGLGNVDNTSDADKPVSTAQQTALDNKVTKNADITAATKCKITYDTKGLVTAGADLQASDIPSLTLSKISDVTATASEVNVLDGITANTSELNILDGATLSTTELNYVDGVTSSIQTQFDNITDVIPAAASDTNQLADKNFVNSSIATNTANFIGTFNSVADLEAYSGTLTNNDYAFVIVTDSLGNNAYDRYKYTTATTPASWVFEYELNNSSFTSDQWAAINSLITADTKVTHTANTAIGSATTPVYVNSNGEAIALSYTIEKSVPSNAVFTDTTYTFATGSANGTISVDGSDVAVKGLGSAAYTPSTDYATATQGGKADSAIQTVKVNGTALTPDANKAVDVTVPTNYVTTDTDQNITGVKTYVGQKRIAFKQSGTNDKLGFTLYNNSGTEKGYLEFNPSNTVDSVPLMTLGNYASAAAGLTHVGFRKYSSISGASGAYNLLAPLISDAKTPFNLTTTYTNFYLPLGFTDGNTTVLTAKSGLVNISTLLPTVPSKISDLTDDTATYPIDKADTLTGLTASITELNYVDGVTSAIQTQLDNKVTKNTTITGATKCKITYDSKGLVTSGDDLQATDIPNLTLSKITDVTASASELNILDGATLTTTELNYVDGVTSSIQTQLNSKQASITGGASTITSSNLTASKALVSNASGKVDVSTVTTTELGYLSGVTSSIQTQLSGKLTTSDIVSSVSSSSTNSKAVGAKLFYDTCGDIETLINAL